MASSKSLDSILFEGVKTMDADMARDPGRTPNESKAIFMLGNTGSGKSTATQIIAGKINQLKAVMTEGGDLIIVDQEEKIGSSTRSMTLYPEYMIHPETGVAFWDTPGFDDNRGSDTDIAAMYLLKHALDTTTLGKFIFVVNHSSVKTGNDRLDFDLLASHATTLLKDISKMKNSIGLLVTKVENYSPSSGEYLSDEEILTPIQYFLEEYVKTKSEDLENLQDGGMDHVEELQAKIDFVQSLLGKHGTDIQLRISFVRSPQNEGPLEEMADMLESQKKITQLYSEVLKYILVSPDDFQFTLKAETLLKMETHLIPEVVGRVAETCIDMALDMQAQFQEKFYKNLFDSPEESLKLVQESLVVMKAHLQTISGSASELEQLFQKLGLNMTYSLKMRLVSLEQQMDFFAKMLNQNVKGTRNTSWIQPFSGFATALEQLKEYYEFCNSTETQLSEYAKVGKFTELVKSNGGEIQYGQGDVLHFLQTSQLVPVSARTLSIWENMKSQDKDFLVRLVKRMTPRLDMKCDKSTVDPQKYRLVITGRNVKLSDAMNESIWPQECRNDKVKELSLVALDKLFLDVDVNIPGAVLQLSIVAPKWEVVLGTHSGRKINLSGVQPNRPQTVISPFNSFFGTAFASFQREVQLALAQRGGDAGSFFGVYSHVQNWEALSISANGEEGFAGGEGGNRGQILLVQSNGNVEKIKIKVESSSPGNTGKVAICPGVQPLIAGGHGNVHSIFQNIVAGAAVSVCPPKIFITPETPINTPWREINEYMLMHARNLSKAKFPSELQTTPEILKLVHTEALAEELVDIEVIFDRMTGEEEQQQKRKYFMTYYKTFLQRLSDHCNAATGNKGLAPQDKVALNLMYSTAVEKVIILRRADHRLNVKNTKEYFGEVALQLGKLKSAEKVKAIQDEAIDFHRNLDDRFKEIITLIEETVLPSVKNAQVILEQMTDKFMADVNSYLKAAEEDSERKKQIERDYAEILPLRNFLMAMNITASAASFLCRYGTAAGYIIMTGPSKVPPFLSLQDTSSWYPMFLRMLPSLSPFLDEVNDACFEKAIMELEQKINIVANAGKFVEEAFLKQVNDMMKRAESAQKTVDILKSINPKIGLGMTSSEMQDGLTNVVMKAAEKVEAVEGQRKPNLQILKNLVTLLNSADFIGIVQSNCQSTLEMDKLTGLVNEVEKQNARTLRMKNDGFCRELMTQLMKLNNDIGIARGEFTGQSEGVLSVRRRELGEMVKKMRCYLQQSVRGFQGAEEMKVCYGELEKVLCLLLDLCNQMERFEEKKEFQDCFEIANSVSTRQGQSTDGRYRILLDRLKFSLPGILFLEQHQKAMHACKKWVFPFATNYLVENEERKVVDLINFDALFNIYKQKVEDLQVQLAKYQAATEKGDGLVTISTFTSDIASSRPFYIWTCSNWQDSITNLLSGQPVQLKADVDMEDQDNMTFFEGKSAIKYKSVELRVKAHSAGKQEELNEKMKRYQMRMTHSGISLYKVRGQNYVMFDKKQTYIYGFEHIGNGESESANGTRYKVSRADADYLQSPYTWWTFQLVDPTPEKGNGFHELTGFVNQIDLELEGKGVYLDEKLVSQDILSKLKLHEHYDVYDNVRIIV